MAWFRYRRSAVMCALSFAEERHSTSHDHFPAATGWQAHECHDGPLWRWADGAAELRIEPPGQLALMAAGLDGTRP